MAATVGVCTAAFCAALLAFTRSSAPTTDVTGGHAHLLRTLDQANAGVYDTVAVAADAAQCSDIGRCASVVLNTCL